MNGEVARDLGRKVGYDRLTKQAAAVYTGVFEKLASKLGKCAGLASWEVDAIVKEATEKKSFALSIPMLIALLAGTGAIGGGLGAGASALHKHFSDPYGYKSRIKAINAARMAGEDPVQMGLMKAKEKKEPYGGYGGYGGYGTYGSYGGPGSTGAGLSKKVYKPHEARTFARMNFDPDEHSQRTQALQDISAGLAMKRQLSRGWQREASKPVI